MREVCSSIVFGVVFRLLFVFFIFMFGVVGATLGVIAGAVIGWSNKMRLIQDIIKGAVSGTTFSYKLIKAIFDCLHFDYDYDYEYGDGKLVSLVNRVKHIAGDLVNILRRNEHKTVGFSTNIRVLTSFFVKHFNIFVTYKTFKSGAAPAN